MQILYHLDSEHCFKYLLYFISLFKMLWTRWWNIKCILYSFTTLFQRLYLKYFNSQKLDNVFSPAPKYSGIGLQCNCRLATHHEFTSWTFHACGHIRGLGDKQEILCSCPRRRIDLAHTHPPSDLQVGHGLQKFPMLFCSRVLCVTSLMVLTLKRYWNITIYYWSKGLINKP